MRDNKLPVVKVKKKNKDEILVTNKRTNKQTTEAILFSSSSIYIGMQYLNIFFLFFFGKLERERENKEKNNTIDKRESNRTTKKKNVEWNE